MVILINGQHTRNAVCKYLPPELSFVYEAEMYEAEM